MRMITKLEYVQNIGRFETVKHDPGLTFKKLVDCRRVTLSMERASIQYALSKRTVRVEPTATR